MTLRTPRRRISPRTKRRYRAIREFFRRALGSSSQPDIKISSSIAVNVTDLKRKIVGLEQQLDEVNKHCQDIACFDCSRPDSESYVASETRHPIDTIKEQTENSSIERKLNGIETKFIYKSDCNYEKSEESGYLSKVQDVIEQQVQGMINDYEEPVLRAKNKKSKVHRIADNGTKLHKHRSRSVYENSASAYSSSSFHSLVNPRVNNTDNFQHYSSHPAEKANYKQVYQEFIPSRILKIDKKHREHVKRNKTDMYKEPHDQKTSKIRKHKHHRERDLDQDFIADIIRRQYKPVKMFGRKESDLSQISAPVCRDQEFSIREDIQEGNELCSCCYDGSQHKRRGDINEMRSICDTRLYSSKKHPRGKHRRMHIDVFNNSDLYDLIPVKEKSSPKTRRKFTEDNMMPYDYYREVPPSPRTMRPRLNLKAQYNTDFEDYMAHVKHYRKISPHRSRRQREYIEPESDMTSEVVPHIAVEQPRKTHKNMTCQVDQTKQEQCQPDTGSSAQYQPCVNEPANVTMDTTFNKTQEETEIAAADKTDKALCEIKDILQSFLHEIKKEANASQSDKSDVTSKSSENQHHIVSETIPKLNVSAAPNSRHSFNNYNMGQCNPSPFMPSFTNPCCYPIMPVCPMNCTMPVPNNFLMPSPSYTCTNCANAAKESAHNEHCCHKNINVSGTCQTETCRDTCRTETCGTETCRGDTCRTETCRTETCRTDQCHTETEELIKEIYKFVAQSPSRKREYEESIDRHDCKPAFTKQLTSRSVGESSRLSKHDAKVGTPPLKCYSKSCEAIGSSDRESKASTEPYSSVTNASYSDTILEKLSLEVTQTTSETEETETTDRTRVKRNNKFSKVLQSIGLFKKRYKKDVIEELSESESATEVDTKSKSPFRQEITNYVMHGQDYYHTPPVPPNYHRPNEYHPDYNAPYNPGVAHNEYIPQQPIQDIYSPRPYHPRSRVPNPTPPAHSTQRPTAPPFNSYDNHYNNLQQPQVPLCLKEIEVKSIGTQSERKMSIFRKIKKKMQPPLTPEDDYNPRNCSTQTQTVQAKPVTKPLFNWKNLQAKAMMDQNKNDPIKAFSVKAQKELAEGDMKLRNAMLKKLFYKRNPFSPRNLIVRTLLGKDKSSYGEAPTMFRPRMFF